MRQEDEDLEIGGLSLDLPEDDGLLVSTDFKPLSNQLGPGSVSYH